MHLNKTDKICNYTGMNKSGLKIYLEGLFVEGMSWENYGTVWEIDHNIPMAWFDFTNESDIYYCCNYKNLQPLFKYENQNKNADIKNEYTS